MTSLAQNSDTTSAMPWLSGVIPPLVTPLQDRNSLDVAGLERLLEYVIGGGVTGLFILGTTGEGPSLSQELRHKLIRRCCAQVAQRVPILVGITDTALPASIALAQTAAEAGAAAVVLAPPYYFPAGQPELLKYVDEVVRSVPLPLLLYNIPSLTKVQFELATVRRLTQRPEIIGIKDSSGDMGYFHGLLRVARERPNWSVLIGPEALLAEAVLFGGQGGVCGGANLLPQLFVELYHAALARDWDTVLQLQDKVLALETGIYKVGHSSSFSSFITGIKCALSCLGICSDMLAAPFTSFPAAERARIGAALRDLGLTPLEDA